MPVVLAKLERALRAATGGLVAKIRTDSSRAEGVGVHPLARYAITCVELLAPHRVALDLILANAGEERGAPAGEDERKAPAGGAEGVTSFGGLVSELMAGMERNLEEKSALACSCRKSKPPNGCRPLSHQRAPSTCSWLAYDILPFRFRGKSHTLGMTEERYKTPPGPATAGRDIC